VQVCSEELEGTSSEIFSVKQALAAVLQQQQEVQCLVQEHSALKSRPEADESHGGEQSAYTFQSFLEKIQRATLLEDAYTHRANLLRAAAETLLPETNQASNAISDPATKQSIDKIQADLHQMEQFYIEKSGPDTSASVQLLIDAKRSQLQELLAPGRGRLQPEDYQHFQTLLSSDLSLQEAFDREARAAHELEQLKHQDSIRIQQRRYQRTSGTPSSKEAGMGPKSRRSGLRVQFSDTEQHHDDADAETQQLKVYSVSAILAFLKSVVISACIFICEHMQHSNQGHQRTCCTLTCIFLYRVF
jgi:hypothetical protein